MLSALVGRIPRSGRPSDTLGMLCPMRKVPKHAKREGSCDRSSSRELDFGLLGIVVSVLIWLFGDPAKELIIGFFANLADIASYIIQDL